MSYSGWRAAPTKLGLLHRGLIGHLGDDLLERADKVPSLGVGEPGHGAAFQFVSCCLDVRLNRASSVRQEQPDEAPICFAAPASHRHIQGAALEAWTLLSALAAQTSRLRLGVMVASNRLRSPTLLAKMAATVDIIAGGRLDFGIGVGASRAQMENPGVREFEAYAVPLVSPGEAVRDLAESLSIIRRMWAEVEPFDFDGKSIQLKGAVCERKPLQKPHEDPQLKWTPDRLTRRPAERMSTNGDHETQVHPGVQDRGGPQGHRHR